jgi:hypothetical protein
MIGRQGEAIAQRDAQVALDTDIGLGQGQAVPPGDEVMAG